MKKFLLLLLILLILVAAIGAWLFLGPATAFTENKKFLYISSKAPIKKAVLDSLEKHDVIKSPAAFKWLANSLDYWKNIRPGRYEVNKGSSLLTLVRTLRNGRQTPVNLVITKLRTLEDLARVTGNRFEFDSAQMMAFLGSPDSLKPFEVQPETAMSLVLPDTYTYFWNTTPRKVYQKLADESKRFWNEERIKKAEQLYLTPLKAYTLASIVEEETNAAAEKGKIASVYLNRMTSGMPLQADPTVKFAIKDFALKQILYVHTSVVSPYNTYRNRGLPPGPICTPAKSTIDSVLNAPSTGYYYFVADSSFNGTHVFSVTLDEHNKKASLYHQAYNRRFPNKSKTKQ